MVFDNATFLVSKTLTLPFPRFEPWSRNVFVSTVHNGWKKCFTQNVAWSYLILRFDRWSVLDLDLICCRFLSILPTLPVTPFLLLLQAFFWIWTMSEWSGKKEAAMDQSFDFPAFIGTTKAADEPLALQYEKYRKKRCRFRVLILTFFGAFWPKKFGGKLDPLLSNGSKFILSTVMHMSINNRWRHWDNHNFTRIHGLITFR